MFRIVLHLGQLVLAPAQLPGTEKGRVGMIYVTRSSEIVPEVLVGLLQREG